MSRPERGASGPAPPPGRDPRSAGGALATAALRPIALSMAGAVALLAAVVVLALPAPPTAAPAAALWIVAGVALAAILVGVVLAVTQAPSAGGQRTAARTLVSLALREAGGLLAVLLYVLGAGRAPALALAGAAAVSILALLPPRPTGR